MVNEDIGEWRCCVADIGLARESVQHLADETIDGLGLMLFVRRAVVVEHLFARVDGCIVGLVVDHQQGQLRH